VVHGIVTGHGGAITVDSTPDVGSTFHLYFPQVRQALAAPDGGTSAALQPLGQGQHVLYVDDDPVMVLMVDSLLQRLGWRVKPGRPHPPWPGRCRPRCGGRGGDRLQHAWPVRLELAQAWHTWPGCRWSSPRATSPMPARDAQRRRGQCCRRNTLEQLACWVAAGAGPTPAAVTRAADTGQGRWCTGAMPADTPPRKTPGQLRSARWFAPDDFRSFGHRSRVLQMGYGYEDWKGKPIIAIVNTWSDANQCHAHFKQRVDDVKRGILQAGGFPLELPAISLSESMVKPTTMLYRNFLAMETEELLRSHPVDGAVLMGGCDKTTPGLLMGALSMGLPFIYLPAGPMLRGNWRGQVLGSGSDAFKYWDERRAGRLSDQAWDEMEAGIARSHGTCMTMGTAATMMGIAEAVGFALPGASSIPAADANHIRMSAECGRRIVQMVWDDLTPDADRGASQRIASHGHGLRPTPSSM
jgi:hypothetical protein